LIILGFSNMENNCSWLSDCSEADELRTIC